MDNPNLVNLAELRQLEARLDQRLELLGKAESSLKALSESLRQQVAAAYPVLNQLKETLPAAREQAALSRGIEADHLDEDRLQKLAADVYAQIEQVKSELASFAAPARQQMIDELESAIADAQETPPASQDESIVAAKEALSDVDEMGIVFRAEVRQTMESLRQSMFDQLDLLQADAKLRVEPIVNQLQTTRASAEAQVSAMVAAHQQALESNVQQLNRSIDDVAAVLEQRLSDRVQMLHRRAAETMEQIEPRLTDRVDRVLQLSQDRLETGESRLHKRLDTVWSGLESQLQSGERQLAERLRQMETHAGSMVAYLEQKLSAQVDDLIHRLRLKLQQSIAETNDSPVPPARSEPSSAPTRPVELEVFVNRTLRGTDARTPNMAKVA